MKVLNLLFIIEILSPRFLGLGKKVIAFSIPIISKRFADFYRSQRTVPTHQKAAYADASIF